MMVQVMLNGKVLYEGNVDYPGIPQSIISELERTWRIAELQENGFDAGIAVIVPSRMNLNSFKLYDSETF
jgi:hypothetical protein